MTTDRENDQLKLEEFNRACLKELLRLQQRKLTTAGDSKLTSQLISQMEFWRRMYINQCPHGKDDNV